MAGNKTVVLFHGEKIFWEERSKLDVRMVLHRKYNCLEVVCYDTVTSIELPRAYLDFIHLKAQVDPTQFKECVRERREQLYNDTKKRVPIDTLEEDIMNETIVSLLFDSLDIKAKQGAVGVYNWFLLGCRVGQRDLCLPFCHKLPHNATPVFVQRDRTNTVEDHRTKFTGLRYQEQKSKLNEIFLQSYAISAVEVPSCNKKKLELDSQLTLVRKHWVICIRKMVQHTQVMKTEKRILTSYLADWYKSHSFSKTRTKICTLKRLISTIAISRAALRKVRNNVEQKRLEEKRKSKLLLPALGTPVYPSSMHGGISPARHADLHTKYSQRAAARHRTRAESRSLSPVSNLRSSPTEAVPSRNIAFRAELGSEGVKGHGDRHSKGQDQFQSTHSRFMHGTCMGGVHSLQTDPLLMSPWPAAGQTDASEPVTRTPGTHSFGKERLEPISPKQIQYSEPHPSFGKPPRPSGPHSPMSPSSNIRHLNSIDPSNNLKRNGAEGFSFSGNDDDDNCSVASLESAAGSLVSFESAGRASLSSVRSLPTSFSPAQLSRPHAMSPRRAIDEDAFLAQENEQRRSLSPISRPAARSDAGTSVGVLSIDKRPRGSVGGLSGAAVSSLLRLPHMDCQMSANQQPSHYPAQLHTPHLGAIVCTQTPAAPADSSSCTCAAVSALRTGHHSSLDGTETSEAQCEGEDSGASSATGAEIHMGGVKGSQPRMERTTKEREAAPSLLNSFSNHVSQLEQNVPLRSFAMKGKGHTSGM